MPTSVSTYPSATGDWSTDSRESGYSPNSVCTEEGTDLLWLCTACAVAVSCCDYSSDNSPASEDVEALGLVTFYESGWDDQEESFRCDCCGGDSYCVPTLFAPEEETVTIEAATESLLTAALESYLIAKDALEAALGEPSLESVAYHAKALASQADDLSALEGYLESERRIGTERTLERLELHAARDEEDSQSYTARMILRAIEEV